MRKIMVLLLVSVVFLSACSTKTPSASTKPACTTNAECTTRGACQESYCASGKCAVKYTDNCCGNKICENSENKCTCASDCGTCSGAYSLTPNAAKPVNAVYIKSACSLDECVTSYSAEDQRSKEFYSEMIGPSFRLNVYVNYPAPLDVNKDEFTAEFLFKDYANFKMKPPITIREARILEGSKVIGRISTDVSLNEIGDRRQIRIPITYSPILAEEMKSVSLSFDYEYNILAAQNTIVNGTRVITYTPVLDRKTFSVQLAEKIVFIDLSLTK